MKSVSGDVESVGWGCGISRLGCGIRMGLFTCTQFEWSGLCTVHFLMPKMLPTIYFTNLYKSIFNIINPISLF